MNARTGDNPAFTLAAFALALLLTFLLAFSVGRAVGPFDEPAPTHPGGQHEQVSHE